MKRKRFSVEQNDGTEHFLTTKTLAGDVNFTNTANFPNGWSWLNGIIPYQGKILSLDSSYGVSVSQ